MPPTYQKAFERPPTPIVFEPDFKTRIPNTGRETGERPVCPRITYGPNGSVQGEYNGSSWPVEYVYAGNQLIAEYTNSTTEFIHGDHLGSTRLVTAVNQSISDNMDYLPFGQQIAGSSATSHKFTGKERDAESGLDNFGARYNASSLGRFMTPDGPLIYASKDDPQTWNLYSYVRNNPLNRVDPNGHLTIIVPGTGYSASDWNMNMKLVNEAKARFHDSDVRILNWSGNLGSNAISEGDRCSETW